MMVISHAQVPTDLAKPLHHRRSQFPKGQLTKRRETKTPIKRLFKVRLVEKSLPVNTEPEAAATTATSTQTSVVKPTATVAKPNPIPLTVYNQSKTKFQGIPNPTVRKFQEGESPFTPNCSNPPMKQQQPKATTTAILTAPLTLFWSQPIYLLPDHGQFPHMGMRSQHPPLLRWRNQKRRPHQSRQESPIQWSKVN